MASTKTTTTNNISFAEAANLLLYKKKAEDLLDKQPTKKATDLLDKQPSKKIITLGNASVGKTCFLLRYCFSTYAECNSTVGVDVISKNISLPGRNIQLTIWDTAGQERYLLLFISLFKSHDAPVKLCCPRQFFILIAPVFL